jgi:hypothetical protein
MVDENTVHNQTITPSQQTTEIWLSVLAGWVRIGKFFYPKDHPAFFDTPIFQPTDVGTFQLRSNIVESSTPVTATTTTTAGTVIFGWKNFVAMTLPKQVFGSPSYPIPDPKKPQGSVVQSSTAVICYPSVRKPL